MEIFICVLIAALAATYFLRAALRPASPAFLQKGILSRDKLQFMLSSLAFSSKKAEKGNGISPAAAYRILKKAYRTIGKKPEDARFLCERTLYDNFYALDMVGGGFTRRLPHVGRMPRVYAFCELFIKSTGGVVTREALMRAVKAYTVETPLRFSELAALEPALKLALSEYLAIYAQQLLRIVEHVRRGERDGRKKRVCLSLRSSAAYAYGYLRHGDSLPENDMQRQVSFREELAALNAHFTAAVQSLHALASVFSHDLVLSLSEADAVLSSGDTTYEQLSSKTKYMYLSQIEKAAMRRKCGEAMLAREILLKAAKEGKDIAFFILPPVKGRGAARVYAGVNIAVWLLIAALLIVFVPLWGLVAAVVGLPIFVHCTSVLCRKCLGRFAWRRELPALDEKALRAEKHATAILMPCYAATVGDIEDSFSRFTAVMQVNRAPIFSYCLLFDYPPHTAPESALDADLTAAIERQYAEIPVEQRARTCVLVRKRVRVKGEDTYRGYEKKRGAVMDFAAYLLRGEGEFAVKMGDVRKAKYIVTLDTDTATYDCAALVAAKAHPYTANVAVLSMPCKAAEKRTPFARLFGGETGPGMYRHKAFEPYNDFFGLGNFTGKGILDIALFDAALGGFFPDNAILSHDFAEGAVAGCLASQTAAAEDIPQSFGSSLSRSMRWLRGDWQLLPYLKGKVKNKAGERVKNPMPPIAKFAIAENLISSLLPIAQLLLLFLSCIFPPARNLAWLAALPQLLRIVLALPSLLFAALEFFKEVLRCAFEWVMLPTVAVHTLFAVCVTLGRLCTRRNLLDWRVFAHERGEIVTLANSVAALLLAAVTAVFSRSLLFFLPAILFAAGPFLVVVTARERETPRSVALDSLLYDVAKRTFDYFLAQKGFALPCDCLQEDNGVGYTMRTSPTNIGMELLAYAAAYEIGLIDKATVTAHLETRLRTLETLETYAGNLFNWYDCRTLQPLAPRFVSSVDSGNLLACLYALRCYATGSLLERLDAYIAKIDLAALYDEERTLLYIGYDADAGRHTPNHYDLLGSESSLTYLIGCASGKLPIEAYRSLNRACVKSGGARTLYSWTGGAFEYLMTRLFLSPPQGSLLDAAYQGAARAHRRYAKKADSEVFGVSECRYNAFDENGGNLYRAFGVQAIAYSEVPQNPPFAPYAACLALAYTPPKIAYKNLVAFSEKAHGQYGFYEALDRRTPVKSYMTHHQGMILAAIASAVKPNGLVGRLQSQSVWRGARLLCGEEPGRARARTLPPRRAPEKRGAQDAYLCSCGPLGIAVGKREEVYTYRHLRLFERFRVFAFEGDARYELTAGERSFDGGVQSSVTAGGLMATTSLSVLSSPLGVSLTVRVSNLSQNERKVRLVGCVQPVLAAFADYDSHPAYSKLFLETGGDGTHCFARRRQSNVTLVFTAHTDAEATKPQYTANKKAFCERGTPIDYGQNTDPSLCGVFECTLPKEGEQTYTFCALVTEGETAPIAALASSPECLLQNEGSAAALSEGVPPLAAKTAQRILDGELFALPDCPDLPTVIAPEDAFTLDTLPHRLAAYRCVCAAGLPFRLALFYREDTSEARAQALAIETEVEKSGLRGLGARVDVLPVDRPVFERMKARAAAQPPLVPLVTYTVSKNAYPRPVLPPVRYTRALGLGGFCGDAYVLDITRSRPPKPWCNILSNGRMGTVLTESGGGFTFLDNARERKLTRWVNDPIEDGASEFAAITEKGAAWSIARLPLCAPAAYRTEHGHGYTTYTCAYNGVTATQTCFLSVQEGADAKVVRVTVKNETDDARTLGVLFAAQFVLGDFLRSTHPSLRTAECKNGVRLVCAKSGMEGYLQASEDCKAVGAFVGGGAAKTLSLYAPHKSCAYTGLSVPLKVLPHEEKTVYFTLSASLFSLEEGEEALARAMRKAAALPKITLGGKYAELSGWLVHQVWNSRFAGRTGFYQVSGAYGFRDQLQDSLALLYADPASVRAHILECARHQFKAGDVQHWWHPPAVGVRTHVCDDRLWLVYAACTYALHTGDDAIFEARVPYLSDVPIHPEDASVYAAADFTAEKDTVYEHCLRALKVANDRGAHGLILLRGGDWLDALDEAGRMGRGESVWCTMFAVRVLSLFLRHVQDEQEWERLTRIRDELKEAAQNAFVGDRFLRATTDDGRVLGAKNAEACKVDLLAQSFAVLCDIGTKEQQKAALETAYRALVDDERGLVSLFYPPFRSPDGIGYLGKYPPFVRENGGQYTQAAVWFVWALFKAGETEKANELLSYLSPMEKCATAEDVQRYGGEPYVTASDVYGGPYNGYAGWTWYTGSASWLYKLLIEQYAGITVRGAVLHFDPHLPKDTPSLTVRVQHENETVEIEIANGSGGPWRLRIGEVVYNEPKLRLRKGLAGKKITVFRLPTVGHAEKTLA